MLLAVLGQRQPAGAESGYELAIELRRAGQAQAGSALIGLGLFHNDFLQPGNLLQDPRETNTGFTECLHVAGDFNRILADFATCEYQLFAW